MRAFWAGLAVWAALAAPGFGQTTFFRAMPDVPLPPGATEGPAALHFETEDGRFTVSFAGAPMPAEDYAAFYAEALPELGWTPVAVSGDAEQAFVRSRDRLVLRFTSVEEGEIRIVAEMTSARASAALD